jgi:hypothetical protein
MRKGYRYEYLAKLKLIEQYGKQNVLKLAIGQSADFIVLAPSENRIEKIVEVKSTIKEKFYPKPREKKQFELIDRLAEEHHVPIEVWIKEGDKKDFEIKKR